MKKLLILLTFQFSILLGFGQANKLDAKLAITLAQFNQMQTKEDHEAVFRNLETLSSAFPNDWLLPYYASLVKTRMALQKMGNADQLADEALSWIIKSKKIQQNDEIYCAESLAYTAKMTVNPMFRWVKYKDKIKSTIQQAKQINANNPRIYVLEMNMQHHLPAVLGGGCKNAIPLAQKAEKLLNAQGDRKGNLPTWGMKQVRLVLNACPI